MDLLTYVWIDLQSVIVKEIESASADLLTYVWMDLQSEMEMENSISHRSNIGYIYGRIDLRSVIVRTKGISHQSSMIHLYFVVLTYTL